MWVPRVQTLASVFNKVHSPGFEPTARECLRANASKPLSYLDVAGEASLNYIYPCHQLSMKVRRSTCQKLSITALALLDLKRLNQHMRPKNNKLFSGTRILVVVWI